MSSQPGNGRRRGHSRLVFKRGEIWEKVEGYVWCDRHGEIHDDSLDPYEYGPPDPGAGWDDQRCQPSDHKPVFIRTPHRTPR